MSEHRSATEIVLDNLVYAPLGFVTGAKSLVPQLAERGRVQVANAKLIGRFAVQMGQVEANKRVGGLEAHMREMLIGFGLVPPETTEAPAAPRSAPAAPEVEEEELPPPVMHDAPDVDTLAIPDVDTLAIPDYDSLAASQVVSRLAGLRPGELTAVQHYELAKRGRKTILGKIAQLQAS